MITEYHLYSDERRSPCKRYFYFGGLACTDNGAGRLSNALHVVRNEHAVMGEMKWTKVSSYYSSAYRAWIDAFFDDPFARFSLLGIEWGHQWHEFHRNRKRNSSYDSAIASAYYQFLRVTFGPLRDTKRWCVFPDANLFSKPKVLGNVEFLFNRTFKKALGPKTSRIIRIARSLDSSKSDLVQLSDVLLGAFSSLKTAHTPQSQARSALVDHCKHRLWKSSTTRKGLERFSAFDWVDPSDFDYSSLGPR